MLHQIFYWVLNMSIIASVFGILLYCLRLLKGFPKLASYALWAVIIIRLLCPIGISSDYSLLNIISKFTGQQVVKTIPYVNDRDSGNSSSKLVPELSMSNTIQRAADYDPITYKDNVFESFIKVVSVIWAIVLTAGLIALIILYCLTKSELKKAVLLHDNIYEGAMVSTPTVYGILKPRLVLPIGTDQEHLQYIMAHENVHIRRHDNVWRIFAILAACVHWFNPLSWIFLKCFLKDCELACDEAAIKNMNKEERKIYALTLLACASDDITVFSSAFGSSKVKVRIESVLSYKKLTLFSTICFGTVIIAAAFLFLTNAAG